jgi:hypothetical protein
MVSSGTHVWQCFRGGDHITVPAVGALADCAIACMNDVLGEEA